VPAAAGRLEEALRRQRRASELEPGNPQHALQCANLLRALGQLRLQLCEVRLP
jgi:predicted Zn-dependent protease